MYRELAHEGVIFGLRGGPYAGRARTLSQAELPPHVLQRLRGALEGEARPAPILKREGPRTSLPLLAPAGLAVASLAALLQLAAWGFGDPHSLLQKPALAGVYALASSVLALSSWLALRTRRALLPRRGVYLLPLDVVEVGLDTLTVTPMGGVRQVTIEGERGAPSLVLVFEDKTRHAFPVATEQDAERAHELLQHSQDDLEVLSSSVDLEKALDLDPFFSLRGTGASGQSARRWELAARSPLRLMAGWLLVGLAGAAAGAGLWAFRNAASDQALYNRAERADTEAAYREYLGAGHLRIAEAALNLGRLRRQATLDAENRHFHEEEHKQAAAAVTPCEPAVPADATAEQAAHCYRKRAARARPEVAAWFEGRIREGKPLRVAFHRARGTAATPLAAEHERVFFEALRKILNEVAPARVLEVQQTQGAWAMDLGIMVSTTRGKTPLETSYAFDVTLASTPKPVTFRLAMPAPTEKPPLRIRSLYTPTESVEALVSARAYDRLYDEVYGLFFEGNPRVPIKP